MFSDELIHQAAEILDLCRDKGLKLTAAESCTGGLIAALLTEIPGSSDVFGRGFVTYENAAKTDILGVDNELIVEYGAVSEQVVASMAQGARSRANADIAVAVTGVAGPGGGTVQKPVGLVYIAVATRDTITSEKNNFDGNRSDIRLASVAKALSMIKSSLNRAFVCVA